MANSWRWPERVDRWISAAARVMARLAWMEVAQVRPTTENGGTIASRMKWTQFVQQ